MRGWRVALGFIPLAILIILLTEGFVQIIMGGYHPVDMGD